MNTSKILIAWGLALVALADDTRAGGLVGPAWETFIVAQAETEAACAPEECLQQQIEAQQQDVQADEQRRQQQIEAEQQDRQADEQRRQQRIEAEQQDRRADEQRRRQQQIEAEQQDIQAEEQRRRQQQIEAEQQDIQAEEQRRRQQQIEAQQQDRQADEQRRRQQQIETQQRRQAEERLRQQQFEAQQQDRQADEQRRRKQQDRQADEQRRRQQQIETQQRRQAEERLRQQQIEAQQQDRQAAEQQRQRTGQRRQPSAGPDEPDTTVEQQLEAQGDVEEAGRVRNMREQLMDQLLRAVAPADQVESERQAPALARPERRRPGSRVGPGFAGRDTDGPRRSGPYEHDRSRGDVVGEGNGRVIIDLGGGRIYAKPVVPDEGGRLLHGARDVEVQQLPGGRTRNIVYTRNGGQVITVRNRYGDILRRVKVLPNGRRFVLIDNRDVNGDGGYRRPPLRAVPPPPVSIPQQQYTLDLGLSSREQIRGALLAPPVAPLPRLFSLDEVLHNEMARAYSPRIDLDTITFDFGSATIGRDQMPSLFALGNAMEIAIYENPGELYLIEGHTDAVGSDYANLILSDRRAEAVAVALSQNFIIPPENLITEGYGEQFLKIPTFGPERRNRRASVRRLTNLLYKAEN